MDTQLTKPKKKLMPIGELLIKSFELYKTKALVMGALMLIPLLLSLVIGLLFLPVLFAVAVNKFSSVFVFFGGLFFLIAVLCAIVVTLTHRLAMIYCLEGHVQLKTSTLKTLLAKARRNVGPYAHIWALKSIIILCGTFLFIVPGIFFSVILSLASFAFVFEGIKGHQALERSRELIKGYGWPIFGRILIIVGISLLCNAIFRIGMLVNMLVIMPFSLAYMYLIYKDLRSVKSTV